MRLAPQSSPLFLLSSAPPPLQAVRHPASRRGRELLSKIGGRKQLNRLTSTRPPAITAFRSPLGSICFHACILRVRFEKKKNKKKKERRGNLLPALGLQFPQTSKGGEGNVPYISVQRSPLCRNQEGSHLFLSSPRIQKDFRCQVKFSLVHAPPRALIAATPAVTNV